MLIARHGGESHYVRPDRVYRTGVLTPIIGFQPQQDVMAVAAAFTQGPYYFQQGAPVSSDMSTASPGVAGPRVTLLGGSFGAVQNLGLLQKLWLRFQAWKSRKNAQKVLATTGVNGLFGLTPYGPAAWAGNQLFPNQGDRMAQLVAIAQKNQPSTIGMNNTDAILARFNYMRGPTR
jgi:hypothetical protein